MSSVCHSNGICMSFHPYVALMYSYVIRMSLVCTCMLLVCTRMSSVCHSYVLVCHPYVTRMWFYHEPVLITVLSKHSMTSSNILTFLTNKVKGLQSSKKRIKLIEYFRSKLNHNGFLFLQETHSTIKNENKWVNDFMSFLMEHLTHVVF